MKRQLEDSLHALWRRNGLLSTLLMPFAWLYGAISSRRMRIRAHHAYRAPVPIIVIGNIIVGGTGKTPVTIALCQALVSAGWHPGIVSRGYGAKLGHTPRLSDSATGADFLGDEPALIHAATTVPVAVHPERARSVPALLAAHPEIDVILADDGLQHTALARDIEIIVQDDRGVGNGRLLPAGPLREPPSRLSRADWLITHVAADQPLPLAQPAPPAPPIRLSMRMEPRLLEHAASGARMPWQRWKALYGHEPCGAAAGIGQPQRFFAMLRHAGLTLSKTFSVADHQPLPVDLAPLFGPGPVLITAKDAVKQISAVKDDRLWIVHPAPRFSDPGWCGGVENMLRATRETLRHKPGLRH